MEGLRKALAENDVGGGGLNVVYGYGQRCGEFLNNEEIGLLSNRRVVYART